MSQATGKLACQSCHILFTNGVEQRKHYTSDFHRYNLKRKISGLPPVQRSAFEAKMNELEAERKAKEESANRQSFCKACRKKFNSENAYNSHLNSNKHKQKMAKMEKDVDCSKNVDCSKDVDSKVTTTSSSSNSSSSNSSSSPTTTTNLSSNSSLPPTTTNLSSNSSLPPTTPTTPTTMEPPKPESEMTESEFFEWRKKQAVKLDPEVDCLFCESKKSSSLKSNVRHMADAHGFYIPDIEYLTDLRGLIVYLGQKISMGLLCLTCNGKGRSFKSLQSVRDHMLSVSHCRLPLDDEETEEEIADFYDFTPSYDQYLTTGTQVTTTTTSNDTTTTSNDTTTTSNDTTTTSNDTTNNDDDLIEKIEKEAKQKIQMNETGTELTFSDGRVVCHRSMAVYYKQRYRPMDNRRTEAIRELMAHYERNGYVPSTAEKKLEAKQKKAMYQQKQKHSMQVGVKANKLQHYYRSATGFD